MERFDVSSIKINHLAFKLSKSRATEGGDHAVARIAGLIAGGLCELGVDAAAATVELDGRDATVAFNSDLCQPIRTITWNYKISPDSDPKPLIIQLGGAQICSKKGQK